MAPGRNIRYVVLATITDVNSHIMIVLGLRTILWKNSIKGLSTKKPILESCDVAPALLLWLLCRWTRFLSRMSLVFPKVNFAILTWRLAAGRDVHDENGEGIRCTPCMVPFLPSSMWEMKPYNSPTNIDTEAWRTRGFLARHAGRYADEDETDVPVDGASYGGEVRSGYVARVQHYEGPVWRVAQY